MRTSIATLLLYLTALTTAKPLTFTIFTAGANTPFWDLPLNAHSGAFYVNRPPIQLCPNPSTTHCTTSTRTIIHGDNSGGPISLGCMVPGGQDIYIAKDGMLGYMKPNSTLLLMGGVVRNPKGFKFEKAKGKKGRDMGFLSYSGGNFSLCGPEDHANPAYKLYIDDGKRKMADGCTPIRVGARKITNKEQVWAYE